MKAKRHWRYKKGIFGRKRREYFSENIFGVDSFDMKIFRALEKKLSRDYLGFFGGLNKMYQRGEFKDIAKESVSIVKQTASLLGDMIQSGTIDKKIVDIIVENVNELNSRRDVLVQKSEEVKALKDRLSSIEETTGVRPEGLNITEKIIRGGARREVRKRREGVTPFLKRTMPRTHGLAGELFGGLGAAAFGPFTPIAKMVGGLGRDIFGLGRGISQKLRERKERKLGGLLSSFSRGLPTGEMERAGGFRGTGGILGRSTQTQARKESSKVLMDFFNRDAYRAKWTKELLKKLSGGKGTGEGSFLDILKNIGKVGLAAGAGTLIPKILKLPEVISDWMESNRRLGQSGKVATRAAQQKLDVVKEMGLDKYAKTAGKSPKTVLQDIAKLETRGKVSEAISLPWYRKVMSMSPVGAALNVFSAKKKVSRITPYEKRVEELEKEFDKIQRGTVQEKQREPSGAKSQAELLNAINKLNTSVLGLSKNVGIEKSPSSQREPGIGNPWDGSDPFSAAIAGSEIELED